MKIRNGFVSNSSSSSFTIVMKNNKELAKENIMPMFKIDRDSFFYEMACEMANVLIDRSNPATIDYLFREYCWTDEGLTTTEDKIKAIVEQASFDEELLKDVADDKVKLYIGWASDEDGGIEAALCDMSIDFEDDDLRIEKEGGY